MPPKKAAKPNAFVMFAQELMKQPGRKYASLKEAVDGASPIWARMNKDQRHPYEEKAKMLKGQMHPSRYTSEGLDVEELTREEKLKNQYEENARQDIRNIITMAYRRGEEALASETFFVIHCNVFCYYSASDRYWPAEIAVLSFSLKDGVKQENIFHYLVQPGSLPIGYKFEAKQHSEETHFLKVPFDSDEQNNQEEVYYNLKTFLEKKKPKGTKGMPILFADKKYIKMIQTILNTWSLDYEDDPELFRVYNLQVLFFNLRNTVAGDSVWPSITFSDRELEKDVYAYVQEIACEFHSVTTKPLYCSQSVVLRYAYVICDNCCADLNIELEPGQHVPLNSSLPDTFSTYGSSRSHSSRSSNFGGSKKGFDSDFDTESTADTWDTQSTISDTSSTVTIRYLDDQFPSLGKSQTQSQNSDLSGVALNNNSSSGKSYAGATSKSSLPSPFQKSMASLSIGSGSASKGRGFRRKVNDSDTDSSSVLGAPSTNYTPSNNSDFPPIGGGRGFIARTMVKPGVQNT